MADSKQKGLTVVQAVNPFWCVVESQPLGYYCPVVDADVIDQAGEETGCIKVFSGTKVEAAIRSYAD